MWGFFRAARKKEGKQCLLRGEREREHCYPAPGTGIPSFFLFSRHPSLGRAKERSSPPLFSHHCTALPNCNGRKHSQGAEGGHKNDHCSARPFLQVDFWGANLSSAEKERKGREKIRLPSSVLGGRREGFCPRGRMRGEDGGVESVPQNRVFLTFGISIKGGEEEEEEELE